MLCLEATALTMLVIFFLKTHDIKGFRKGCSYHTKSPTTMILVSVKSFISKVLLYRKTVLIRILSWKQAKEMLD